MPSQAASLQRLELYDTLGVSKCAAVGRSQNHRAAVEEKGFRGQ